MVNGNYVLYGDRPSSESEIVDDHIRTRTAERKNKRKSSRNANELQRTLNMAQLDNETDSVKYEKKIKEPRLLRYVPTTDVEENYVTEKFETYDLKPTEEPPRRYTFQKKPRNPTDGSVNYAYSRSSSSCSSPNLPTISEHGEQYGMYRVQPLTSSKQDDMLNRYDHKLDKYFYKPKDVKKSLAAKGSHPDSLYRVQAGSSSGVDKMARLLRILRWPVALVIVCIALGVFVYFLMPENIDSDAEAANGTYWEPVTAGAHSHANYRSQHSPPVQKHQPALPTGKPDTSEKINPGSKTTEIDFYDAESDKDYSKIIDNITKPVPHSVLPIKPVFPSHITPEVQYGNEKSDADKLRTAKVLEEGSTISDDSTLKPHITQKPEKPLAVYFKDLNEATMITTEAISRAETVNEFANYGDKQTTKKVEIPTKSRPAAFKELYIPLRIVKPLNLKPYITEPDIPQEVRELYPARGNSGVNFTSGHSNLFGISIEDAERMKSTTQSSLYNTRVSPTLPTWRDGDDATTKKYPVIVNNEVPLCRSTRLPLCNGVLPYDLAGAPATIAGLTMTSLLPQIEYLVATNCSERVKHFMCALLEPECNPPLYPPKMPCYNLCRAIVDACDDAIPRELGTALNCHQYSRTNCVAAKSPCLAREHACGDGTCVPRDWICDGTSDCSGGEDENDCTQCQSNEYRCKSGGCILKRWLCDGYADCPNSEDESEGCERHEPGEPGEEFAGSAPAPVVRRPNRVSTLRDSGDLHKTGENDNSKELLITSDTNNALKRNFTRRPSLARLTPYNRSTSAADKQETNTQESIKRVDFKPPETNENTQKTTDSMEDVNIGDLGFFEELKKTGKEEAPKRKEEPLKRNEPKPPPRPKGKMMSRVPAPMPPPNPPTKLDKSINKLEKVINGAALLKKAQAMDDQDVDSLEKNATAFEGTEDLPSFDALARRPSSLSGRAHASPCPSGELRCVDGRCITLAQLCDGTIDCTDHADEDNCYT